MLRPGDHIWAGVGQSPLLVAHEREDLPSRALRPLRLPNQDFVLHYQGKYYTTAVKTLACDRGVPGSGTPSAPCLLGLGVRLMVSCCTQCCQGNG
jgi:hypothetical protein